jgi:hypothetical protein
VTLLNLVEAAATRGQEETSLASRAMACDEFIELRSPADDDNARREAHRFPAM